MARVHRGGPGPLGAVGLLLTSCALVGGIEDVTVVGGGGPAVRANVVFVTSTEYDPGSLGGLAGADAKCRERAMAGGLAGTYVAWLSTSSVTAVSRLAGKRGWVRPDGRPFGDTLGLIVGGQVFYPPRITELGTDPGTVKVVTGTLANGNVSKATASEYAAPGAPYTFGYSGAGTIQWTAAADTTTGLAHLYCFGADLDAAVAVEKAPGRIAFVSEPFALQNGLAGADAFCASNARASGLPGTYKAFLSTTTFTPSSRFSAAGQPWVRPDGVMVVAEAGDLLSPNPKLLASINVQANGVYQAFLAWAGSASPALVGTPVSTCGDWQDASSPGPVKVGRSASTAPDFFNQVVPQCGASHPLYCLQE